MAASNTWSYSAIPRKLIGKYFLILGLESQGQSHFKGACEKFGLNTSSQEPEKTGACALVCTLYGV